MQIRIENDFEAWAESLPIENDAQIHQQYQVVNPAPIHTNSDINKKQQLDSTNLKESRPYAASIV